MTIQSPLTGSGGASPDTKTLLKHSPEPMNEPWFLRELAEKTYKDVGHTKEGQQTCVRLRRIADMLEEAQRALSDEAKRQERLERIAELALTDVRTHSRDVDDYLETLEFIAAIARGLKEYGLKEVK